VTIEDNFLNALNHPDAIRFPENTQNVEAIKGQISLLKKNKTEAGECWFINDAPTIKNTRIKIYPTGHMVFYDAEGRRFLFSDPEGEPLHEALWGKDETSGETILKLARMQLDCKQWVGLKPQAKTFTSQIDISSQEGWEKLVLDDLREKAAEAWRVPFSEVKYFYTDDRLTHQGGGKYKVELVKDGLYALIDGTFEKNIFISFMFSVNWANLDLIPVVELFQSTLPGSGGAVFEFVWGLCDDQSRAGEMKPLLYRGLPTYPSRAAFNIFSSFFEPKGPRGQKIFQVFMDPNRSHEIEWTLRPHPPWRYFSKEHKICLTVQEGYLFKVTGLEDDVAIPYINTMKGGKSSCERDVQVGVSSFLIRDGALIREIPFSSNWKITPETTPYRISPQYPYTWKWFFNGFPPKVDPVKKFYALPFYPEGAAEIDESGLQPMALDQIIYYMEMSPGMPEKLKKVERVLIHTFDMVIAGCVDSSTEREYTVLFSDPELAQRNAQLLWDHGVSKGQLDNLKKVSFLPERENVEEIYKGKFGLIFKWIPQMYFQDQNTCQLILQHAVEALLPGGILFLAGPRPMQGLFDFFGLDCHYNDTMGNMPFFQQHLKMCPENKINPDQTIFYLEKRDLSSIIKEPEPTPIPDEQLNIEIRGFSRN